MNTKNLSAVVLVVILVIGEVNLTIYLPGMKRIMAQRLCQLYKNGYRMNYYYDSRYWNPCQYENQLDPNKWNGNSNTNDKISTTQQSDDIKPVTEPHDEEEDTSYLHLIDVRMGSP